ncbi:MAG: thermostable hemolysin [Steroidobacteraceae bacterium]
MDTATATLESTDDALRGAWRLRRRGVARPVARRARRLLEVSAVPAGDAGRAELEAYVAGAFNRSHDADVRSFMPTLLAFRDGGGALRGVLGLRGGAEGRLYLEQYLDRPIEAAIADATGRNVPRGSVVEVGNLATASCLAAVRMVAQMPAELIARDYRWIVFTATSTVHGILLGFGAPLVELARADRGRVAGAGDRWGRYYENDPRVYAGYLPDSRTIPGFVAPRA